MRPPDAAERTLVPPYIRDGSDRKPATSLPNRQSGPGCRSPAAGIGVERLERDELRALQAPLKDRYREAPAAAVVTLRVDGTLGDGISCSVETGRAIAEAGLHPASGGDGLLLCSGDMLLQALAACAGVTLRAVATSLDIPINAGTVHAEGDVDFRGTLAVAKDASVGFTAIRLRFELDSVATEEQLSTLIRLTERYCVVYQTLARPPTLSIARTNT